MEEKKDNRYPQVLFLENDINRAYDGSSWKNLLSHICVRDDIKQCNELYRKFYPLALERINKVKEGITAWQSL